MKLRRGVKQGDPLSQFIFNAIINRLLEQLEIGGFPIDVRNSTACLAFADDLLLLGKDINSAKRLPDHTEDYLAQLGMTIAASKCSAFQIVPRDSWFITKPEPLNCFLTL
jgi:hypothetical protein